MAEHDVFLADEIPAGPNSSRCDERWARGLIGGYGEVVYETV